MNTAQNFLDPRITPALRLYAGLVLMANRGKRVDHLKIKSANPNLFRG
ncbi:MAG: hypothetical protein ACWA40_10460 [Planktomarina sp.]